VFYGFLLGVKDAMFLPPKVWPGADHIPIKGSKAACAGGRNQDARESCFTLGASGQCPVISDRSSENIVPNGTLEVKQHRTGRHFLNHQLLSALVMVSFGFESATQSCWFAFHTVLLCLAEKLHLVFSLSSTNESGPPVPAS
jgi:hypothetical protein